MMVNASFNQAEFDELSTRLGAFSSETSAPFHLASAIIAIRNGELPAAKNAIELAVAISPDSEQVHLALAAYHEKVKDQAAVLASLKKASLLSPPRSSTRLRYARALAATGKRDEAVAMVREMTEKYRFYLPGWRKESPAMPPKKWRNWTASTKITLRSK